MPTHVRRFLSSTLSLAPVALLLLLLLAGAAPLPARAAVPPAGPAEPMPPNPFAGFEAFRLANGMKVWYRHSPGATLTSMAVIVPYGRDHDPPGKEQTAHLLEHVLLSDRAGRTEAELARELAARGGSFAGVTGPHYTLYPVHVESAHAVFGVQWLHDVIAPRLFPEDLVERNRQPVLIEMESRRRPLLRGAAATLLRRTGLRAPGFWEREFGYPAHEERGADEVATLSRITARDLRRFYDTYYAPSAMTLVVIGGMPSAALLPAIEETFGTLPWRPEPPPLQAARVRQGETGRFVHGPRGSTRLTRAFRIPEIDGRDALRLAFIEDMLRYRLNVRLRAGEVKSVYGVTTMSEIRGSAALFAISVEMAPQDEAVVRDAVQEEIDRIRNANGDTAAFYADRDVLGRMLRLEHASPGALRAWAMARAWRPDLFDGFPDVGEYYATAGPDSIAAFASRTLAAERSVTSIARPLPLHLALLLLLGAIAVAAAVRLYRRHAWVPADMNAIRFVARVRRPLAVRAVAWGVGAAALIVAGGLAVAALHLAAERWLLPQDAFALAVACALVLLFLLTLAALAVVGRMHATVLVFEDEIRIKSPTYRSEIIPGRDVRSARRLGHGTKLRLRRPAPAAAAGAVVLEFADGSGHVLHVRHPDGLIQAVERLVGRCAAAGDRPGEGAPSAESTAAAAAVARVVPASL